MADEDVKLFGTFGDTETAWIFTEKQLTEMRTDVHEQAEEAVLRWLRSPDGVDESVVGPSPGKKAKVDVDVITLAEDLTLQVIVSLHGQAASN